MDSTVLFLILDFVWIIFIYLFIDKKLARIIAKTLGDKFWFLKNTGKISIKGLFFIVITFLMSINLTVFIFYMIFDGNVDFNYPMHGFIMITFMTLIPGTLMRLLCRLY